MSYGQARSALRPVRCGVLEPRPCGAMQGGTSVGGESVAPLLLKFVSPSLTTTARHSSFGVHKWLDQAGLITHICRFACHSRRLVVTVLPLQAACPLPAGFAMQVYRGAEQTAGSLALSLCLVINASPIGESREPVGDHWMSIMPVPVAGNSTRAGINAWPDGIEGHNTGPPGVEARAHQESDRDLCRCCSRRKCPKIDCAAFAAVGKDFVK